jgi:hypothetical protein
VAQAVGDEVRDPHDLQIEQLGQRFEIGRCAKLPSSRRIAHTAAAG